MKKALNILIIDDSPEDHVLYQEYLAGEEGAYHILNAYSGEEGERLYLENTVDCVIVDYRLPDIDGLEVLKRLTSRQDVIPAVMLTGEGNETIAVIAMKIGSQDYLPKRVITPQALKRAIERAMERTQLTRRMEAYREELARSNEDLERFATIVAHDLKSPLRAVSQHLQLVREHNQKHLDERSLQSIEFAVSGAERMRQLIDALFHYSKASFEKRPFAPVSCHDILCSVKSNLAAQLEETQARITNDELPMVMADGIQIMQLLQNLIGNALKFCDAHPEIHISAHRAGPMWEISVRDNGIGIPPSGQKKIFSIFKRLHSEEKYPGTGVGLAICERVVQNHGGRIGVHSEPHKGSTFTFTLPACDQQAQERAA